MDKKNFKLFKEKITNPIEDPCIICGKESEHSVIGRDKYELYCKEHYNSHVRNRKKGKK